MKPVIMKPVRPKKTRAKRVDREGQEQAALMKEIELCYPEVFAHLHHTPTHLLTPRIGST